MKVAMIGQKGMPLRSGGVEIHVEEIAARLATKGYSVTVFCRRNHTVNRLKNYKGVELKSIPSINTKHLDAIIYCFLSTIYALLKGYDIFHYHALGPSTVAWIPKLFRKKVVCTVHGLDWQREKWKKFSRMYLKFGEYCSAKFSDKTISVSKSLLACYKDKYGVDVCYIANGITIPEKCGAKLITEKYGIKKNGYILFLARLVPEKGAHYLIKAYKHLNTDKKLVIAGGASHSDSYVKSLYKLADNSDNIIFTGFCEGQVLEELYSNAFIYVLPSDIEGMPISLLEAMSYGAICLASDIDENYSVLGNYGVYFKHGNVDDLYEKMSRIINNSLDFEKMKQPIRKYLAENFNWDTAEEEVERIYEELMSK